MAQKIIDFTGSKGLTNNFWGDTHRTTSQPNLRYDAKEGEMVEGIYNPLIYTGYLAPSNNSLLTISTGTVSTSWWSGIVTQDFLRLYLGNDNEHVWTGDISFVDTGVTYTYEIGDVVKFEDLGDKATSLIGAFCVYQINEVQKIFYSSASHIGVASMDFATSDNDYFSTLTTGGFGMNLSAPSVFMRVADNGFMYIFDGFTVHKLDGNATGGATGTATQDVLLFPENLYRISDAIDSRGLMYIAINTLNFYSATDKTPTELGSSLCGVYVWDRLSTSVRTRDFIPIESIQKIVRIWTHSDGILHLMTIGSNGLTQIRRYNGNQFVLIKELPRGAKVSLLDGLIVAEGMTIWAGDDGYIYGYRDNAVFKMIQYTSNTLSGTGGTVLLYASNNAFTATSGFRTDRPSIYIAYRDSGQNSLIKRWFIYGTGTLTDDNGGSGEAFISPLPFKANQGNVYTPVYYMPFLCDMKSLTIYCAPGTTSDSTTVATMKIYFNQSSSVGMTKTITKADVAKGYVAIDINKAFVNAVQFEIEWDTDLVLGTDDFMPSIGILNYQPTTGHAPSIS